MNKPDDLEQLFTKEALYNFYSVMLHIEITTHPENEGYIEDLTNLVNLYKPE